MGYEAHLDGTVDAGNTVSVRSMAGEAAADQLQETVARLQAEQSDFIVAQLQHLRELAVLNRAADTLTLRRGRGQIIDNALREALTLGATPTGWFIELDGQREVAHVWTTGPCELAAGRLPEEAQELCTRVGSNPQPGCSITPTYDPTAEEAIYLAVPALTGQYLLGILVLRLSDVAAGTNSELQRLLLTLLHQTAAAVENASLFSAISRLLIDTVVTLALAVESRDPYTGGHVMRVTAYAVWLGQQAGLGAADVARLRLGAMLHDIGKIGVPDQILRKPAPLDKSEWQVMQTHAAMGRQMLSAIPQLKSIVPAVANHHESFDGRGYPDKLAGEAISLLARIVAIADTYDAMTTDRPYRKGMPHEAARAEIQRCAGRQFDPRLAESFAQATPQDLAQALADLETWRRSDMEGDGLELWQMLDLNRPRLG